MARWSVCCCANCRTLRTLGSRIPDPGPRALGRARAPGSETETRRPCVFERDDLQAAWRILARRFQGRRTIRLWADEPAAWRSRRDRARSATFRCRLTSSAPGSKPSTAPAIRPCTHESAGSIAAPTAGLHFTDRVLDGVADRGVERVSLTLHVGYGTFKPVRVERRRRARGGSRVYTVPLSTAAALTSPPRTGRRDHRGRHHDDSRARVVDGRCIRSRAAGRWQHLVVHSSLPSLSPSAGPHHELSPAALVAPDAGRGIRWPRADPCRVSRGRRSRISLLQLRRRDADCLTLGVLRAQGSTAAVADGDCTESATASCTIWAPLPGLFVSPRP